MESLQQSTKYRESPRIYDLLSKGEAVPVGFSNSDVYRITDRNSCYYLKIKPDDGHEPYSHEASVLGWLAGRVPVAEVEQCGVDNGYEYMLLSAVKGENCCSLADEGETDFEFLATILGAGLRLLHCIPIDDCPFEQKLDQKLEHARGNVESGRIKQSDLDRKLGPLSPQEIYTFLVEARPSETELVFSHGDYCLPNVLVKDSVISGYIDLYWAGVSDKYCDLAIASRSIAHNLGDEYQNIFYSAYGLEDPDLELIKYYRLLDELF